MKVVIGWAIILIFGYSIYVGVIRTPAIVNEALSDLSKEMASNLIKDNGLTRIKANVAADCMTEKYFSSEIVDKSDIYVTSYLESFVAINDDTYQSVQKVSIAHQGPKLYNNLRFLKEFIHGTWLPP